MSSKKACLAELDIGIAELDKANDQQHNGHAGHAQDVAPVHDAENRVAIQVEDGERHDPRGQLDRPLERFLQEGQGEIRGQEAG